MQPPIPFDIKEWFARNPHINTKKKIDIPKQPQATNQPNKTKDAYSKAKSYLSKTLPAIQGQGGGKHTYGVCCALIKGFCLTILEAIPLIESWNSYCQPPWSRSELEAKLLDAERAPDLQPRGWMLERTDKGSAFGAFVEKIAELDKAADEPDVKRPHSGILDDPAAIALNFYEDHKSDLSLCEYRWWMGQFYKFNGSYYEALSKEDINSIIFWFIENEFIKKYIFDCSNCEADEQEKIVKKKVNNNLIENVKTGLVNLITIASNQSEPFWLKEPPAKDWLPDEMIAASNRLIHLPSFVNNRPISFMKKTPRYFNTYNLKYEFNLDRYDGPVEPPPILNNFLDSTFPDDTESKESLQEWIGYLLIPCTKLQKMLMFIGQKRSGKGTIIRLINSILGEENICYPTFKSLTTQFGKQALIGKSLAVFPDARITGRTDVGDIVELLLSITGEDAQTIDRKYLSAITKRLTCRFLISSNELPRLSENSGALASRAIILKFNESFINREDSDLEAKLLPEIPQIFRWALDGWHRLFQRGRFLQPESGAQIINEFLHLSSPVNHFINDCIDIGDEFGTDIVSLFNIWKSWCEHQNKDNVGDMDNFRRNMRAAVPNIRFNPNPHVRNGDGVAWSNLVRGVRLRPIEISMGLDGVNGNGHENGNGNGHEPPEWYENKKEDKIPF